MNPGQCFTAWVSQVIPRESRALSGGVNFLVTERKEIFPLTELFGSKAVGELFLFLVLNTQCGADPPLKATPPGWISKGSCLKTPKKSDQKYPPSFHVLVELEASRYLQQVPNGVSFLASKGHDTLFLEHSLLFQF